MKKLSALMLALVMLLSFAAAEGAVATINFTDMLPADQLHQTHVIFDRIFGDMLNEGSTSQVLFAGMMTQYYFCAINKQR